MRKDSPIQDQASGPSGRVTGFEQQLPTATSGSAKAGRGPAASSGHPQRAVTRLEVDREGLDFRAGAVPFTGLLPNEEVLLIPLSLPAGSVQVTALHLQGSRAVVFLPQVSFAAACRLGPSLERHAGFPEGASAQFVKVLHRRLLQVEVWEQGHGYALFSHHGAIAAAAASRRLGWADDHVRVQMPGGEVDVLFSPPAQTALATNPHGGTRDRLSEWWAS